MYFQYVDSLNEALCLCRILGLYNYDQQVTKEWKQETT